MGKVWFADCEERARVIGMAEKLLGKLVRAAGLEPAQALRPYGF